MSKIDTSHLHGLGDEKLEALIETMYLAASADGEFSETEREHFKRSVESLTDGHLTSQRLEALLVKARSALQASSRDERLKSVKQRLPEPSARKVALSLAIQVTAADGIIRTSERELILQTAEALEIDSNEAADLVRDLTSA